MCCFLKGSDFFIWRDSEKSESKNFDNRRKGRAGTKVREISQFLTNSADKINKLSRPSKKPAFQKIKAWIIIKITHLCQS